MNFSPSGATAKIKAFIHDISFSNDNTPLTIAQVLTDLSQAEIYTGFKITAGTLTASRGSEIVVDLEGIAHDESTKTSSLPTISATSSTIYVWDNGSITIDGTNYDGVVEEVVLKIDRSGEGRGGLNRTIDKVVLGNRTIELTAKMDLPSNALRTLRRNNTSFTVTLSFINVASDNQAVLTLTGGYVEEEPLEFSRDDATVKVSAVMTFDDVTVRVYDSIFDHTA